MNIQEAYEEAQRILQKNGLSPEEDSVIVQLTGIVLQHENPPHLPQLPEHSKVLIYDKELDKGRAEHWARLKYLEDCCLGLVNRSRWPYPDGSPTEKVPKAFMDYLRAIIKRMEKELPR